MEITLNYLSIWQEKQGLFNTIAPISSWCFSWKPVWAESYIGSEERCTVQVRLASLSASPQFNTPGFVWQQGLGEMGLFVSQKA